jgi:hypothetical protein
VSDVEVDGEFRFERRKFGSNPEQLRSLATWLVEQEAEEVVMESTAQYWKPVWEALEFYSSRRTCMGSTREARREGRREAAAATMRTSRMAATSVGKSVGETP